MFMKKRICVKTKKLSTSPIIKDLFDKTNTICVTGQMASGKNFVCSELEKMGWTSVDADCLVHKAIDNSTEEIVQTFLPYTTQAKLQILNNDNTQRCSPPLPPSGSPWRWSPYKKSPAHENAHAHRKNRAKQQHSRGRTE